MKASHTPSWRHRRTVKHTGRHHRVRTPAASCCLQADAKACGGSAAAAADTVGDQPKNIVITRALRQKAPDLAGAFLRRPLCAAESECFGDRTGETRRRAVLRIPEPQVADLPMDSTVRRAEVVWFEGNFKEYDADLRRRAALGKCFVGFSGKCFSDCASIMTVALP